MLRVIQSREKCLEQFKLERIVNGVFALMLLLWVNMATTLTSYSPITSYCFNFVTSTRFNFEYVELSLLCNTTNLAYLKIDATQKQ